MLSMQKTHAKFWRYESNMNKFLAMFFFSLICLLPNLAKSKSLYIFGKTIDLPENCVFYANNKTFGCEDVHGGYASVSFTTLDEHNKEIKNIKVHKKTNPSFAEKIVLDVKTSNVQDKKHTLLVFDDSEDPIIYSYTICGEKNCISILSSDMEFIRGVFLPLSDQFIFWNAVDEDS